MLGAVSSLRLEIRCGPRSAVHVVEARELSIGAAPTDDVVLDHPSVEPGHARVALRRDRILVVPSPRAHRSVRVGPRVIGAPVVAPAGATIHLGEVTIVATPLSLPPVVPPPGVVLDRERAAPDEVRRFEAHSATERALELAWATAHADDRTAWSDRVARSASVPALAPLIDWGSTSPDEAQTDVAWVLERVSRGVRLSVVLEAVARGALTVPREAAVIIVSQLAAGLTALQRSWGPHGALDGRLVQLGTDGRLVFLRPGPVLAGWSDRERRRYLAPERRRGGRPSLAADAWAVARIARDLGAPPGPWARLSDPDPARRPTDLTELAEQARRAAIGAGLDPSTRHLAQLVDLVFPSERPLARVNL